MAKEKFGRSKSIATIFTEKGREYFNAQVAAVPKYLLRDNLPHLSDKLTPEGLTALSQALVFMDRESPNFDENMVATIADNFIETIAENAAKQTLSRNTPSWGLVTEIFKQVRNQESKITSKQVSKHWTNIEWEGTKPGEENFLRAYALYYLNTSHGVNCNASMDQNALTQATYEANAHPFAVRISGYNSHQQPNYAWISAALRLTGNRDEFIQLLKKSNLYKDGDEKKSMKKLLQRQKHREITQYMVEHHLESLRNNTQLPSYVPPIPEKKRKFLRRK